MSKTPTAKIMSLMPTSVQQEFELGRATRARRRAVSETAADMAELVQNWKPGSEGDDLLAKLEGKLVHLNVYVLALRDLRNRVEAGTWRPDQE